MHGRVTYIQSVLHHTVQCMGAVNFGPVCLIRMNFPNVTPIVRTCMYIYIRIYPDSLTLIQLMCTCAHTLLQILKLACPGGSVAMVTTC